MEKRLIMGLYISKENEKIVENPHVSGRRQIFKIPNPDRIKQEVRIYLPFTGEIFLKSLAGMDNINFPLKFITAAYGTNDWEWAPSLRCAVQYMKEYFEILHRIFPTVTVYVLLPFRRLDEGILFLAGDMCGWRKEITGEVLRYSNMKVIGTKDFRPATVLITKMVCFIQMMWVQI